MRHRLVLALSVLSLLALPGAAVAQHRQPHAGSFAIGADAGVYVPPEEFHAGFNPDVFAEFHFTGRIALRGTVAYTAPNFDFDTAEIRQVRAVADLVINWETGLWHPFVNLGFGGYWLEPRSNNQSAGSWQTKGGISLGGGLEYFVRPKIAFKFETTYHYVPQGDLPGRPQGLAATVGIKKYFF